jgi:hypothetical protein
MGIQVPAQLIASHCHRISSRFRTHFGVRKTDSLRGKIRVLQKPLNPSLFNRFAHAERVLVRGGFWGLPEGKRPTNFSAHGAIAIVPLQSEVTPTR